jgi:hypothetical protein
MTSLVRISGCVSKLTSEEASGRQVSAQVFIGSVLVELAAGKGV